MKVEAQKFQVWWRHVKTKNSTAVIMQIPIKSAASLWKVLKNEIS